MQNQYTIETKAFSWHNGGYKFLSDDFPNFINTRMEAITNSGGIAMTASEIVIYEELFDYDGDGFMDSFENDQAESRIGLLVPQNDADGNLLPDDWETFHNVTDPNGHDDNDGLVNLGEYIYFTDPNDDDTDNDGLTDGWEVTYGHDPTKASDAAYDADSDGLTALEELAAGTNPVDSDTDGDGGLDGCLLYTSDAADD